MAPNIVPQNSPKFSPCPACAGQRKFFDHNLGRYLLCFDCGGFGEVADCPRCGGLGLMDKLSPWGEQVVTDCSDCVGTGRVYRGGL